MHPAEVAPVSRRVTGTVLCQRENQKHWTEYVDSFFKVAPRPAWMERGVPCSDNGKRNVWVFFKKSTDRD